MRKIATVALREFGETVKTRAFFIGVVLVPGLIVGLIFGSKALAERTQSEQMPSRRVALLDHSDAVAPPFAKRVAAHNAAHSQQPIELEVAAPGDVDATALAARVRSGDLYAFVEVPADAIARGECRLMRKDQQLASGRTLNELIEQSVIDARFAAAEPPIDRQRVAFLQRDVAIAQIDVASGAATGDDTFGRALTPFIFMFMLYMGTFGISMGLLTSVLEEKSTRVVEVLLAAISPTQLMAGKILGMAAVGVLVLCTWGAVGYFGAKSQSLSGMVTGARLAYVALYFVPGFLLMSALMAGIGAACNTLKEAQSMVSPLSILNIVPLALWFVLSQRPDSALAIALSFIPPITPFVMILRLCAAPDLPTWQIVATLALLWASVFAAIWAAGKVFRVGVLMYGKPPTIRELLRWVRYA